MKNNFLNQFEARTSIRLNSVQQQAVEFFGKPLLLLACPGSGKTTTIITKIGYLIEEKKVNPRRIKAITFSKFSAGDMKKRYDALFGHLPEVSFSTIHSLAFEIIRFHYYHAQISYTLIEGISNPNQLNKRGILRTIFREINEEIITEDQMDELITFISFIKNQLIPKEDWKKHAPKIPKVVEIVDKYEQFKQASSTNVLLDFDDMLTIAYELLKEEINVRRHFQRMFDFVLTDESQDTSKVQHKIVELLVEEHQNLCVVADDDQSIYRFRGADPSYLLNFQTIYPEAKILFMEQNYRSTKNIVETTNRFIKKNVKRYAKEMFTENEALQPIKVQNLQDYVYQNKYVIEKIKEIHPTNSIAILYRNHFSSIPFINLMEKEGIRFTIKDNDQKFFRSWVVEDILNIMRLSYNSKKVELFEKVALKLGAYITKEQLKWLKLKEEEESCFDFLIKHPQTKSYQIIPLKKAYKVVQGLQKLQPLVAIEEIRYELGYDKSIEKSSEIMGYNIDQLKSILNLLEEISSGLATLEQFAKRLSILQQTITNASKQESNLTLSTFHSSKGLEFDYVFIIDAVDGIIPSKEEKSEDELLQEATRLFYVAMTRAKMHLEILTYKEKNMKKVVESEFITYLIRLLEQPKFLEKDLQSGRLVEGYLLQKKRSDQLIKEQSLLKKGMAICHSVFGEGVIIEMASALLVIDFNKSGRKTLSIEHCLSNELLSLSK